MTTNEFHSLVDWFEFAKVLIARAVKH